MIEKSEQQYLDIMGDILSNGEIKETRNGRTKSIFGAQIRVTELREGRFPMMTSRKNFLKGIAGEWSAFLNSPKTIKDFEDKGCNYWKLWGNNDGSIAIDYGNAWTAFDGDDKYNQIEYVLDLLKNDPSSRRIIFTGWNPKNIIDNNLNLPCCHHTYQFVVSNDGYLNLKWIQRSVDWALGNNLTLASLMLISFARASNLKVGDIIMDYTDVHIYEEHWESAKAQYDADTYQFPTFTDTVTDNIYAFTKDMISIDGYQYSDNIKYKLKA